MSPKTLLAFAHIPKTGGTTINRLLWRTFGVRHIGADYRNPPPIYMRRDMELDLKLYPFARSVAGHGLKPFVDYGDLRDRLVWFTMLRDPVRRYLSHYQQQFVGGPSKFRLPFPDWMRTFDRDNVQVRFIAGSEDLERAQQILADRFLCVGIMEKFDESMCRLKSKLQLPDFRIHYSRPANVSSSDLKKRLIENIDMFRGEIEYRNRLDIELYTFAKDVLWPRQSETGCEEAESEAVHPTVATRITDRANEASYLLYRRFVYKPVVWMDRRTQSLRSQAPSEV